MEPESDHSSPAEKAEEPTISLDDIFELSAKGKISNTRFVVGETTANQVEEAWGAPEQVTEAEGVHFLKYSSHAVDIGMVNDEVRDIPACQKALTNAQDGGVLPPPTDEITRKVNGRLWASFYHADFYS
ncbi:DUF4309 domain-containing protein [Gracilibacillus alcaliphilus]|uniref:DUF4309 domain-containing protein n=1 Tax=Gracilibacillus alcaliphilus TaxID=1401441 RepID=UPI00195BD622|nr:DUF4309 domain-containing protein [Gracilibacillus alcaliphilus]MBM7675637.1 hypothetical protein [Gracilibacillus alcaliphilus]